ncbi:hypothetical protein CAPTEDRAFT_161960 [Capitella teleta]|uniref:t-SNARE coiled-coil homology domain-containing protein n=1 Tax=Capitella teleta TaxID=283909 RepID=R7TVN6_CAPTE|nr:hypothetical protein CAPTEDRAFT_161960 [Capitella teleta]|eukprot:ELT95070.1 hypothetical protein CAPTEDRAFT_161960 [Capitella teleta]
MSSEVFESREIDIRALFDELDDKVNSQLQRFNGEAKKRLTRECERGMDEASLLIQEMEDEIRKAPTPYRSRMVSRVRSYKATLESLSSALRNQGSSHGNALSGAAFGQNNDFEDLESAQRSRLMQGSQILQGTTDSISRSHQIAAETDMVATDVIDELGTQRESLIRTRDRLHETDENLSKSNKILKGMAKRVMTNKMILVVIILLEMAILGGVVYWKFFSK